MKKPTISLKYLYKSIMGGALLGIVPSLAMATTLTPENEQYLLSYVQHQHSTTCSHWKSLPISKQEKLLLGRNVPEVTAAGVTTQDLSPSIATSTQPASTGASSQGPQVVYLDFDSATTGTYSRTYKENPDGTGADITRIFDEHIYSAEERAYIQQRFQADYGQFNFQFTTEQPTEGEYSTIFFNANMPGEGADAGPAGIIVDDGGAITSILFGIADSIDFRNLARGDNANVDGNVWALFSSGGFEAVTGMVDTPENRALATVIQSAQTGAHELGHIQGLRHYEAWGPIGEGLPTTGTPPDDAFLPEYTGPRNGTETTLHLMGSGFSAGLSLADSVVTDRFFSERSAIKLAFNENGQVVAETDGDHSSIGSAQMVDLAKLDVPNTIVEGRNANNRLNVNAISIEGSLSQIGEWDWYAFHGEEGDIFNLEVISLVNSNNDDFFDSILYIFDELGNLLTYSDDEFESPDSFVFDFKMDYTGIFYALVTGFDYTGTGFDQWSIGNYQLFVTQTRIPAPSAFLLMLGAIAFMLRRRHNGGVA
tara:strand:- start:569 stop:2182 length:1614 start_codon:yes stop_codon:yes gene_type:complete